MLSHDTVREVKRLLGLGLSRRVVALKTGCSRGAVNDIAAGAWDERAEARGQNVPIVLDEEPQSTLVARCPGCGAKAEILASGVCRGCQVLATVRHRGPRPELAADDQVDDDEPDVLDAAIAARRDEIRRSWSPRERGERWRKARGLVGKLCEPQPYTIPIVSSAELREARA